MSGSAAKRKDHARRGVANVPMEPVIRSATGARRNPGRPAGRWSPEASHARGLLHDDTCVVEVGRPRRLTVDQDMRAGPHGQSRTAPAALLVAHDIAPLG